MMKSDDSAPSKPAVSASAAALAAAGKSRPSTTTSTSTSTTTTSARPAALSASSSSASRPANKPANTTPANVVEKATLTMSDEQSTERAYGIVSEENWTALADANWKTRLQGTFKRV